MKTRELKALIEKRLKVKLASKNRKRPNVDGRAVYYRLMREINPDVTLMELGKQTGGRHHATVINSLQQTFYWLKRHNRPFHNIYVELSEKYGKPVGN